MLLFWCLTLFPALAAASGPNDVFTSVASIKKLILIEREYGRQLEQLKRNFTTAYNLISKYIEDFRSLPLEDPHVLAKDPIFMFQVIRRLGFDYRIIQETLRVNVPAPLLEGIVLPTREDAFSSAIQLTQLQALYNLSSHQLALGKVLDIDSPTKLTAADMLLLHEGSKQSIYGNTAYNDWKPVTVYRLLKEAGIDDNQKIMHVFENIQQLFKQEMPPSPPPQSQPVNETSQSINMTTLKVNETENLENETQTTDKEISEKSMNETEIEPGKIRSMVLSSENLTTSTVMSVLFQDIKRKENEDSQQKKTEKQKKPKKPIKPFIGEHDVDRHSRFRTLCNGIKLMTPNEEADLKCEITTLQEPWFILRRVKREMICRTPPVFLFHDFISAQEAEIIKNLAEKQLKRSSVVDPESPTGSSYSKQRISKTAWIFDNIHPSISPISARVGKVTGLVTKKPDWDCEPYQVVNYGLGGEYYFHWDDTSVNDKTLMNPKNIGGRIATFLIFLEDVQYGGHTVFPDLGIFAKPKKGTAILWYNLFLNGTMDGRTVHGGCPVLYGSKWISNKWIHYKSQLLKRPCGLSQEDEHTYLGDNL